MQRRRDFLQTASAFAAVPAMTAANVPVPQSIAGIQVPQSDLAKEAAAIASSSEPVEVFRHSLRTFLFAELLARKRRIAHDPELVYLGAILHDTGLAPAHMSEHDRFQVDGANLSGTLLRRHGVAPEKAEIVWDAIALHDQGGIARYKRPEVMLVSAGVGADFGAFLAELERNDVLAVLDAAPRHRFFEQFLASAAAFVKKKPNATGNSWVTDVGYRLIPGFHLDNFVDDLKDDPFASYYVHKT